MVLGSPFDFVYQLILIINYDALEIASMDHGGTQPHHGVSEPVREPQVQPGTARTDEIAGAGLELFTAHLWLPMKPEVKEPAST